MLTAPEVLELKPDGYLLKTMPKEKIVAYIDVFLRIKMFNVLLIKCGE